MLDSLLMARGWVLLYLIANARILHITHPSNVPFRTWFSRVGIWLKDHLYEHLRNEFFTSSVKRSKGSVFERSFSCPLGLRISCDTSLPI
jgi:hypothetical protein